MSVVRSWRFATQQWKYPVAAARASIRSFTGEVCIFSDAASFDNISRKQSIETCMRKSSYKLAVLAVLMMAIAAGASEPDVVVVKSGNRMTGSVTELSG